MEKIFHKLNRFFANNWRLAVLDLAAGRWFASPDMSSTAYLKHANALGRHILMKPENESFYMLADDLNSQLLQKHHKTKDGSWRKGRLVVETSPFNYQVWIRSHRPLALDEKRYWLSLMRSDPGAGPKNRWGRMPGFRNRKEKYRTSKAQYPLARLIWVDWQNPAVVPLVPVAKPFQTKRTQAPTVVLKAPVTISRNDYDCGNESITDFRYALALARRGVNAQMIEAKILCERKNWKNHSGQKRKKDYLKRTIEKAINIVDAS